jgi:DNA-binding transcriptional MerR regulator
MRLMPTNTAASADTSSATTGDSTRLLRIHEAAELVGLTPRTIRYYEEVGLLEPAARSEGAYRLYDEDDLDRLRYIKAMRDDAGFSLAEIGLLLEDEQARSRSRERYLASTDPGERRSILEAAAVRLDRLAATLRAKRDRIESMIVDVEQRRARVERRLAELGPEAVARPRRRSRS